MAWKREGRQLVYYRNKRIDGHVRTIYYGAGEVAKRAAAEDAAKRAKRAADQAELVAFQTRLAGVDQLATQAAHGLAVLTEGTLLALGFHEHHGQWRRWRDGPAL